MAKSKETTENVRKRIEALKKETGWSGSGLMSLLKGGGSSSKGGAYERELCKRFGEWWTNNQRDDVFWRSSNSGGRATVRAQRGKTTSGQYGDIAATDEIGRPLLDVLTIEIKRGYDGASVQDVIDRKADAALQQWEAFALQAKSSSEDAGSFSWALITRRDRRDPLIWYPVEFGRALAEVGGPVIYGAIRTRVSLLARDENGTHNIDVLGHRLDDFFLHVRPKHIHQLSDTV